jgi:hypothetical protein
VTSCRDIYNFLNQVRNRSVTAPLTDADAGRLAQLGLVAFLDAGQYRGLQAEVATIDARQAAIAQEGGEEFRLRAELDAETRKTHSILFHFEGREKQQAEKDALVRTQAQAQSVGADLTQKEKELAELVAKRSLLDTLGPCGNGYVALTGPGQVALRDLGVRMYRAADLDFSAYWDQCERITGELNGLAANGAAYVAAVSNQLAGIDRSQLWATSLGLAQHQPSAAAGVPAFVQTYRTVYGMSANDPNRWMASEILCALAGPVEGQVATLASLVREVRGLGVPSDAALGVAAVLLFGRREDGSFATANLAQFLRATRSYESAALLAILNRPVDELGAKFASARSMFASWGYNPSEDVELSSAFLAVSELPIEGISTKLAIIARGLRAYLEYPLVAASILTAVATLEANETLNLLEQAYEIVGRRAMPMTQPELICLAVRMVHGIRNELVRELDATARVPSAPAPAAGFGGPRFFFVPVIVAHGVYYSTFSGVGGAHPAHVHAWAGGGLVG